jgi:hypothetical protein
MRRILVSAAILLSFSAASLNASAAPACRDAKGKFMKCAPAKPATPVRCKDAKGKFAKCGSAGAKPV